MRVVTTEAPTTVAEHIKWRRPRNQLSQRNHIIAEETDPRPQIQSTRCKSTISSLLLSTFSNNSTSSNDGGSQSRKKSNFSAAATLRGLGCTAGAPQEVSVPAVIRSAAEWEGKKVRKKKHKRSSKGSCSNNGVDVDFQDVWCGTAHGIGFSADCVVGTSRKNASSSSRPKIDVHKINHRQRSSSCLGRRSLNPETISLLDTDPSDVFTPRSASEFFGPAAYYRHLPDPSTDAFPEIMMLQGGIIMGSRYSHDQFRDLRLDVDNMSYEQLLELGERIGYVNTGLKENEMGANIRKTKLQILDDASNHQVDKTCTICQEEYEAADELGRLHCEHSYHFHCIKQWVAHKNFCPVCKQQVVARNN
ncbi:hypothetical protein HN51_013864 [Arachis hypogaea]|uniref:RING-type E3 ubiquitin transferase n=1 Tax=Arachis hypogaea TaxID=3818 RepID=A0A445DNG2_ARAHY|nr:uncharacterized protein LOC112734223 [Arachis hypogaea]RYR64708.1 hypothetical protein Ahy_A03g010773 [Arachis hypogaea]